MNEGGESGNEYKRVWDGSRKMSYVYADAIATHSRRGQTFELNSTRESFLNSSRVQTLVGMVLPACTW
jgi:hypothetical protein